MIVGWKKLDRKGSTSHIECLKIKKPPFEKGGWLTGGYLLLLII